MLQSAEIL